MKNRVLSAAFKSTAIVLMLLSAFAIAFPMMRVINGKLYQLENYALSYLTEKTGLTFSYESLSPAILTGLNFKGISISDPETETILLHMDSVKVSYKLWPLIHGRVSEAIGRITVNGLELQFNDEKNMKVVERILSLLPEKQTESNPAGFVMPFPVTLKNCSFTVLFRGMSGRLELEEIALESSHAAPYTTNVETTGSLSFIPDDTLTKLIPKLTTDLKIQAQITPDLNGTLGRFELKKTDGGAFSFNDIEFVAGMEDRQLSLSVFTPEAPYGVEASWNMETGAVHAELNAEDFDPFAVIKLKNKSKSLDKVKGTRIDGHYGVDLVLGDNAVASLQYNVDGSVYLPPGILKDELEVSVAAEGDLSRVSVSDLQVVTKAFSVNYYGDVNIEALNLSGYLKLGHYLLPSGKRLEGEFYIEDLQHGFSAFSPQFMLGDVPLTGVQLECVPGDKSADISLSVYDYSHAEAGVPGHIQLDGSLLYGDERFLQASFYLENEFVDNLLRYADNVLPPDKAIDPSLLEKVSPYILTCEAYGSTDFDSLSFNVPYVVVANTQKDNEMLLVSLDGNETTAQISQLELLYAGQQLSATVNADADDDYSEIFFSTDFTLNDVPYYFSGVYNKGREIVVNGDYDFELRLDLRVKKQVLCSLYADTIPVKIKDYLFSASIDTEIDFTSLENFFINLTRFEVSENSGKLRIEPRVELTGFADHYGLMLETITYGDSVSIFTGNGSVSWNMTSKLLDSAAADILLENPIGNERITIGVSVSNPEEVPFADRNLLKELYVSGTVDVESLMMSRFLEHQQQEDKVTVHGTILGQVKNPFVSLEVPELSLHAKAFPVTGSLNLTLDDRIVTASDLNVSYKIFNLEDFGFELSLEGGTGFGYGMFNINSEPLLTASSPVAISFALDGDTGVLEEGFDFTKASYEASLVLEDIQTGYDITIEDYAVNVRHDEGLWYLTAGTTGGISGFLLDTGEFYLSALADFPVSFIADGSIKNSQLDIQVSEIEGNINSFSMFFNKEFSISNGAFAGDLHLGGKVSDPDIDGSLNVENLTLLVPGYVAEPLIAKEALLIAEDSTFTSKQVHFDVGKGQALADLTIEMDRWNVALIDVAVRSVNNTLAPAKITVPYADCVGDADVNIDISMAGKDISVTGSVNVYNGIVELHTEGSSDASENGGAANPAYPGRIYIDMNLGISQKAELYYPNKDNPLIRGLVTTQEPVHLVMDSDTAETDIQGSLVMRGGEILYLNRNFYLREGSIEFNENGGEFDPRISFRAEVRERDAEGEPIKIILSADRQKLSELSPALSSEPSKTEDEIRMLLGAALIADTGSTPGQVLANVAASGFDFLLQNSLFRQVENRLRDLCNFDIFSFRTPFIQQALLQAMNNSGEQASLGNYFDNTTVYIGKYIGNTIYLDALLRFVYQDKNSAGNSGPRLAFQPEIGLELPSPFATIRWSIAPDITSAKNLWVPYTSISLSWSFKF